MACVLRRLPNPPEFEGDIGKSFCLGAEVASGVVKLVSASYAGETKTEEPFCFQVKAGLNSLTALIEASQTGVETKLIEKCDQDLRVRRFDPEDPIFEIEIRGV